MGTDLGRVWGTFQDAWRGWTHRAGAYCDIAGLWFFSVWHAAISGFPDTPLVDRDPLDVAARIFPDQNDDDVIAQIASSLSKVERRVIRSGLVAKPGKVQVRDQVRGRQISEVCRQAGLQLWFSTPIADQSVIRGGRGPQDEPAGKHQPGWYQERFEKLGSPTW